MTAIAAGRLFRQTAGGMRRVQCLIGDSETSAQLATGSLLNLPFAIQKVLFRDSVFLTATLLTRKYHGIFTHLTNDEKLLLYLLTLKMKRPAVAVEIGSFLGASACFLALGLGRTGRLYCVDTWNNDAMDEPERDTFNEFMRNVRNFREEIVPLRGTSARMATKFDRGINFLFVDGDHSYEECLNDWLSWSKFLEPEAIVVFHDVGWAEGVIRVVREHVSPLAKREVGMNNMHVAWL
jgi:predicted O-methyltransferase YrrM